MSGPLFGTIFFHHSWLRNTGPPLYFAGQASAWLLQKGNLRNPTVEPIAVQADPPYDLLLAANGVLLGPHKAGKIVLILREKPGCTSDRGSELTKVTPAAHLWRDP